MNNKASEYLSTLFQEPLAIMTFIRQSEDLRNDICPSVGIEIGSLLSFLVESYGCVNILEIGTSIGYSACWLGLGAMKTGGKVKTIEASSRLHQEAMINIKSAGLANIVSCECGLGEEILKKEKNNSYDFIFIDSSTRSYLEIYEASLPLLKKGGILVIEDILFAVNGKRVRQRELMKDFNKFILEDGRITATPLTIGDGLMLCRKKG